MKLRTTCFRGGEKLEEAKKEVFVDGAMAIAHGVRP
jgi:hypothetical protein